MGSREKSILKTLLYSDIFDYPLTKEELYTYLILENGTKISSSLFNEYLKTLRDVIDYRESFFCVKGRKEIINKRISLLSDNIYKLNIANRISSIFSYIPTVRLVGVSGSLAMHNAQKDDDIDFFIITSAHCVWITRLLLVSIVHVLGYRRKKKQKNLRNKVCLNMFVSSSNLKTAKKDQNLYTAHEIAQLKVLINKNDMHRSFLLANSWVLEYMPHVFEFPNTNFNIQKVSIVEKLFQYVEPAAKYVQKNYMKKHITTEIVTDTKLAFHPINYRDIILQKYKRRLKKYKI